ncbi:hypothetical protein Tco_0380097, partial [Tanacetum coccineum]
TSVYTDSEPGRVFWGADEEIFDGEVPRVIVYGYDGLPMQPVAPPSPDYVPGPEHPPSPIEIPYVPEPEYPEYLVPSEDEAPMEDQPLPADASPVATLITQTTSLQTQLTTVLGRIATLEARDPEPQDGPVEAGSSS